MHVLKSFDLSPKEEDLNTKLVAFQKGLGFIDGFGHSDGQVPKQKICYIETQLLVEAALKKKTENSQ